MPSRPKTSQDSYYDPKADQWKNIALAIGLAAMFAAGVALIISGLPR